MYVNAPRYLLRKKLVLRLLENAPRGSALDIGCGAGDMVETLHQSGYTVKGIDFSADAIALCRERLKNLLTQGTVTLSTESIADLKGPFDLIIMMEVLEHIENDADMLDKINRLLGPTGQLIISVPAHQSWFGPSDKHAGHYRRYDKGALIKLLNSCGLEVNNIWSYGVPLANITESIRNMIYADREFGSKEDMTKQSGIDRRVEARFKYFLNDLFLFPFYVAQELFLGTDWGTGYILKATKR